MKTTLKNSRGLIFLRLLSVAVVFLIQNVSDMGASASAQVVSNPAQVWLVPQGLANPQNPGDADFMNLFLYPPANPPAADDWSFTAANTQVFMIYGGLVMAGASPSQFNTIVSGLNARGISIAFTGECWVACGAPCGTVNQTTLGWAQAITSNVQAAGGTISYIAMDEPLFWGHFGGIANGGTTCTVADLISSIQPILQVYTTAFPGIQIGEEEPTTLVGLIDPLTNVDQFRTDYREWLQAFKKATGKAMAFVQMDTPLANYNSRGLKENSTYVKQFYSYAQILKSKNFLGQVGIIIDGSQLDPSDQAWVTTAQERLQMWSSQLPTSADQLIFQSWNPSPSQALPETASNTLTSLVPFYFNFLSGTLPSAVSAEVVGNVISASAESFTMVGLYNGVEYSVSTVTAANTLKGGELVMAVGDLQGLGVTSATYILPTTVAGVISSLSTSGFVLQPTSGNALTVLVTSITKLPTGVTLASLTPGEAVSVTGFVDSYNLDTARSLTIPTDNP